MESYQSDICRFIAVTVSPLFEKYQLNIFLKKVVRQNAVPSVPTAPPVRRPETTGENTILLL